MTNYNIVLPTPSVSKHNAHHYNSKAGPKTLVKEPQHHNNKPSKPKTKKQQPSTSNEKQELAVATNNNSKQVKKKVKSQQPPAQVINNNKKIQQQQKTHHHQHNQQQRRNVMPVKVRRVERRKEIVSMTEALHTSQADLLSTSPPVSSSSSNESSDDSDTGRTEQKSFKKKQPNLPSPASFPPLAKKSTPRRQQGDKKVYAGPTFNNAPPPNTLPLPSLSESQPSPPIVHQEASFSSISSHHQHHEDIFFMEVIPPPHPHLQQFPPHPPHPSSHFHQVDLQQQSRDLMNLLAPRRHLPLSSMVMPNPPVDHTLSQIQRDLRSMLKLEAA
jgi:hypothetical protein